jgi:hypothetical protein
MSHRHVPLRIAATLTLLLAAVVISGSPAAAEDPIKPAAAPPIVTQTRPQARIHPVPSTPSTTRTPSLLRSSRPGAAASQVTASGVVDASSWPIANYAGNGCIVARGPDNEAPVVKTGCSLTYIDQYWSLVSVGSGYYQVRNSNSGKCIVVRGNVYNTAAVQYTCASYIDQHWVIVEDTTGRYFMVQNRASGMCLVLRASENNARQVTCDQQYIDQWWQRGMPSAPARTNDLAKPVYFVHGYTDNGSGFDANGAYWGTMISDYIYDGSPSGFSGPIARAWTFCYYSADTNCDLKVTGDRNRAVKDVGADLAWEIYDHFSKFNVAVDAVGHSMGGLVIRAAITGVQKGDPAFPPYLYVEDVTTLSTPHRGDPAAGGCVFTQCYDMRSGSAFLTWLNDNAQASSGTDWTLIGFDDDLLVPVWSSVPDNMPSVGHKVIYDAGQVLPKIYAHMDQLQRTSGSYNYSYCDYFSTGCSMGSRGSFYHVTAGLDPGRMTRYGNYYMSVY